jgi:hypothetical protein
MLGDAATEHLLPLAVCPPPLRFVRHEGDPLSPEFGVVLRGVVGAYEKSGSSGDPPTTHAPEAEHALITGAIKRVLANGATATGAGLGKLM